MAISAKFFLKSPNSKEPTLVLLVFKAAFKESNDGNVSYKHFKYSTGEKIHSKHWDKSKSRVRQTSAYPGYPEFNQKLNNYEAAILDIYRTLQNNGVPITFAALKEGMKKKFGQVVEKKTQSFIDFIDNMVGSIKHVKAPGRKMQPIKESTRTKYKGVLNHLKKYEEFTGSRIRTQNLDSLFYDEFVSYMEEELELAPNTIGKIIATLKVFIGKAIKAGLPVSASYDRFDFVVIKEDVEKIYLTQDELNAIAKFDLTDNPSLDRVRDLFIIGAHTALRFSDFTNIKPENIIEIKGKKMIKMKTIKTEQDVIVPVHPHVDTVLKKYNHKLPATISNQKSNKYIKDVCELVGIDKTTPIVRMQGSKRITEKKKKWELVTTHTARRSAATNMYLAGIEPISIMRITGHKTETAFLRYICMSNEESAINLKDHAYFKSGQIMKIAK